jgi:hydrogenase nickel incorporation protein HypA/HybF
MHELSIVFDILDTIEETAKENKVKLVKSVTLEIGEVSTIVPSYFEDIWKWAVEKRDVTKGCKLKIIMIKAVTICNDCKTEYDTLKYAKICPKCGSSNTVLLRGNELNIKEMEVI